jgi:aryl-alcohol dehydrogenase-like predicted oxidoreductase
MTPENYARMDSLSDFAQERGHTLNELAHAWLMAQPQVSSVISGATRVEHVLANAAANDWNLNPDEVSAVNAIL